MSPKESPDPKPVVTRNSSEFKLDLYASIPQEELVVFAVQVLLADDSPAQTEDVVSTCFRFFPHSFALKNYFYWPDSALVARRLQEAREKGLLKGNPTDGFEVKVQGRKTAKLTGKSLGVSFPIPPKAEVAAPVVETSAPVIETKGEAEAPIKNVRPAAGDGGKSRVGKKKKKVVKKPAVKKSVVKKKPAKPVVERKPKKKIAKPVAKKKSALKRKAVKPVLKAKARVKPVTKAKTKVQPKPKPQAKQKRVSKQAKATQLTLTLNPLPAKKKDRGPAAKPKVREEAQQVAKKKAPVATSKEEKDKAAKVIKQLERSDAYQLYRRNGRRANIGEFDFRNMLVATMESSAETLKRNTDLFKRYAGIHFRADLIAFLEYCEKRFSALLISKVKGKR